MAYDWLKGIKDEYDVIVIGSGLGGLTGAKILSDFGYRVLLLEQHHQYGGLATWFRRKGQHIFDISLHGFPSGMIKSCRRYWGREVSDHIVQIKDIRFINPQMNVRTTFTREDYTRILTDQFKVSPEQVKAFYEHLRAMNYYDQDAETTGEMFNRFFPGRTDVHRLLMEPITYANGSSFEDPAITYGIVFSNFMGAGVYTYQGGSDRFIKQLTGILIRNGVDLRKRALAEKITVEEISGKKRVSGVIANGRRIRAKAVLSNANLKQTIFKLTGKENFPSSFTDTAEKVRLNTSSCQIYLGIRRGDSIPNIGDLIFTSDAPFYDSRNISDIHTTSRTFSVYYPKTRPDIGGYAIVASLNARYEQWSGLSEEAYKKEKFRLIEETFVALEKFIPDIRQKVDWVEAATPKTIQRYTSHPQGTSFGTKFEGLPISMGLSDKLQGLYHTGSVGIIMSGWLGAMNYGVIAANKLAAQISRG